MPTSAGEMTQTPPGNPQWRACNGSYIYGYQTIRPPFTDRPHTGYSTGNYRDYWRRNMGWARTRGIGGWLMGLPYDATTTWYVTVADDSGETSLTTPPTVRKPPAGVK